MPAATEEVNDGTAPHRPQALTVLPDGPRSDDLLRPVAEGLDGQMHDSSRTAARAILGGAGGDIADGNGRAETAAEVLARLRKQSEEDVGAALLASLRADNLAVLATLKGECPGDVETYLFGLRKAGAKVAEVNRLRSAVVAMAKRLKAERLKERRRRRAEARVRQDATVFRNFEDAEHVDDDSFASRTGLPAQAIEGTLLSHTGGWPKRVGTGTAKLLFVEDTGPRPLFLENANQLFAWVGRQFPGDGPNPVKWAQGEDLVTEARFHAHLRQSVEGYEAVEPFPHHPPLPGHYYMHPPPRGGDGRALRELLGRFCPAGPIDADLIKAFFLSLAWGGPPGSRPAWLLTSKDDDAEKGRGIGKSKLAMFGARLFGGHVALDPNEKMSDARTRLLSPSALLYRVVLLDNVKTLKFSWGELEGLITSDIISGHMLYHGEGTRPNTLTFVITLNGASLSKDMAQRVIPIHLNRPDYSRAWEEQVLTTIDSRRWEIVGDILAELRRPVEQPAYDPWRWATWGAQVLSRVAEPYECQKVILERQGDADDDQAEAEAVRATFIRQLVARGHNPQRDVVFIPSEEAAAWVNAATNEKRPPNKACSYLNTLPIPELRKSKKDGGRGWRWQGSNADPSVTAVGLAPPPPSLWRQS